MSGRNAKLRTLVLSLLATVTALGLFSHTHLALAQSDGSLTVQIDSQDNSGVTGTAILTADGDQTIVDLELVGAEAGYEGHIFDSTCDNHQAATVFYAIEPVDDTLSSQLTLDVSFEELTNGTYWIHIHKPGGERGIGVACGQIPAAGAVGGELPSAGVGMVSADRSNGMLLLYLAISAGLLGTGLRLRDRQRTL